VVAADVGGRRKRWRAKRGRGERERAAMRWGKICGEASVGRRRRKPRTEETEGLGEFASERATERRVGAPAAGKSSSARGDSSSEDEETKGSEWQRRTPPAAA
jgi:hypothetical protein